ncbi:hypothetical protein acsn021_42010 [Anaerocolumna cellulosilytica]|uniref:Uncharacterized protein n=1 Tax=Anaerocolumna cellulosilytica TaxID=433286 RepID=A0A6S6RBP0_9FIRM|nr:hypothetical protein acsn021_42010 [Anaerocolumna cellulosilytica]
MQEKELRPPATIIERHIRLDVLNKYSKLIIHDLCIISFFVLKDFFEVLDLCKLVTVKYFSG